MSSIVEDEHYPFYPHPWPSDNVKNFPIKDIFYGLKDADYLITSEYVGQDILVKTLQIPKTVLESIMQSDEDREGFLIQSTEVQKSETGVSFNFGGRKTRLDFTGDELYPRAVDVYSKSITSDNNLLKEQISQFKQKYLREITTFEDERLLKLQLYATEDSTIKIINFQWKLKDMHRRKRQQRSNGLNLCENGGTIDGNLEVNGNLDVNGIITANKFIASGADLAEYRPICLKTKELFDTLGTSGAGRVLILAKNNEYTTEIPDYVRDWYEFTVVSSNPGLIIGKSNQNRFENCVPVVIEGYIPVCFVGDVKKGDWLIPSGKNDGTAKAWDKDNDDDSVNIFAQAQEDGNNETKMVYSKLFRRRYPNPAKLSGTSHDHDRFIENIVENLNVDSESGEKLIKSRCCKLSNLRPRKYRSIIKDILTELKDVPHDGKFTRVKKALTKEINAAESAIENIPPVIELRPYQKELVKRAQNRKRSIVILPTGTGKTFIAAEIIYQHLTKMNGKICVFLCTTNPLRMQQEAEISGYIDSKNQGQYQIQIERDFEACSATNKLVLEDGSNKLFVMTAGGFNNVNLTKKLIDNIDLIVMDEIHHLECKNKNHPYNEIVEKLKNYYGDTNLLGLTATPAAAVTDNSTRQKFDSLQNLFQAKDDGLLLVTEEKEDLKRFCNKTEFTKQVVIMDPNDKRCMKMMKNFIEKLEMDLEDNIDAFDLDFPEDKDVYNYQKKVTEMAQKVLEHCLKKDDEPMLYRNQFIFLSYLSEALSLVKNLGHEYAIDCISTRGRSSLQTDGTNSFNIFDDEVKNLLNELESKSIGSPIQMHRCQHPKFLEMKKSILEYKQNSQDHCSRVLIFADTRRVVKELSCMINKDPDFEKNKIHSEYFIGHSSNTLRGRPHGLAMSQSKQLKILQDFATGKIDVLVSTTIGEEGIDITNCNLVIQYAVTSSGKSLQQRAGRARAVNSAIHSIYFSSETKRLMNSRVELDRMNAELERRGAVKA